MLQLALAFAGVVVLAVPAVRVALEVQRFARAVEAATERIGRAAGDLERAAAPLATRTDRDPGVSRDEPGKI